MLKKWQAITLWKRVLIGLAIGLSLGIALFYGVGNPDLVAGTYAGKFGQLTISDTGSWEYSIDDSLDAVSSLVVGRPEIESVKIDVSDGATVEKTFTVFRDSVSAAGVASSQPLESRSLKGATTISGSYAMRDFGIVTARELAKTWLFPLGDAFVRLIKMLVVPLIATTLISGVTAMGDPKKLGSLGLRTISLYLLTTFFAVTLGLIMGTIIRPGAGVKYAEAGQSVVTSIQGQIEKASESSWVDRLLEIIPTNPIQAVANGDVLPTIFFAILFGVGILLSGKAGEPVKAFFDAASDVVMRITILVMELAPLGVLALMAWVMATYGFGVVTNMGKLALALYAACFLQIVIVYAGIIVKGILRLPVKQFFRGIADAQGVAFSTSSSNATLPVTISCAENNLGVEKSVAGSVLPLGATINMDGTAIYLGLIALFAAQAIGMPLSLADYFNVALTATLLSIGAAGIPSAGLLLAATILRVIHVGEAESLLVIAFIFPFDRLLDMMRTVTNITGDLAVACTVAKWEGAGRRSLPR